MYTYSALAHMRGKRLHARDGPAIYDVMQKVAIGPHHVIPLNEALVVMCPM